jgi:hypothetical protein
MAVEVMIDLAGPVAGQFFEFFQRRVFHVVQNLFPELKRWRARFGRLIDFAEENVLQNLTGDAFRGDALRLRAPLKQLRFRPYFNIQIHGCKILLFSA